MIAPSRSRTPLSWLVQTRGSEVVEPWLIGLGFGWQFHGDPGGALFDREQTDKLRL
jgi:hypothetical protein